ncbi:MAG: gliding motility-associated C-terminal domain-containing protein [Bacteroidota bacterium]
MNTHFAKYLLYSLLFVNVKMLYSQTGITMDSLVKQWELNGVPAERVNDYREYISNRYKKERCNYGTHTQANTHKTTTESLCFNPGFELSDFSNWARITGISNSQGTIIPMVNYNNTSSNNYSYNTSVMGPDCFAINSMIPSDSITGVGYDYYSFDGVKYNFKTIPNTGGNYSARIGHADPNYKASKIEYEFKIAANEPYIIYNYAFVLSDGSHVDGEQAAFSVKLTDSVGNVITMPNLPYMVNANDAIGNPDFNLSFIKSDINNVYYKKWTTDTINLCEYIGRTFKLVYEAIDCIHGAHFCYAYVDAKCSSITIPAGQAISCRDSLNTGFVAPPGYTNYQWTDAHGNLLSAAQGGNQSFLSLSQYLQNCSTGNCSVNNNDVFTLTMTTDIGCVLTTLYTVKNYSIGVSSFSQINSCVGGNSGSINLLPTGGLNNSPYNYLWYSNNCSGNVIGTSNPLTNIPAGDYCVHISNGNCIPKDTIIHVAALPDQIKFGEETLPACIDSLHTIHAGNGSDYLWYQNNVIVPNQNSDSLQIDPMDLNSSYTSVYTNPQGCKDSTLFHLSLTGRSTFSVVACPNDSIALFVSPASHDPETYQWYLNGSAVSTAGQNDSIRTSVHHSHYMYVSYYTDNCKKIADDFVKVFPEQLFLPDRTTNVFTPNNDGANDIFYPYEHSDLYSPKAIDLETNEYELAVYNRWGTLIFRAIQYSQGWNGKTIDNIPASDGTYFWIASYVSNCTTKSEKTIKKGFVHLVR